MTPTSSTPHPIVAGAPRQPAPPGFVFVPGSCLLYPKEQRSKEKFDAAIILPTPGAEDKGLVIMGDLDGIYMPPYGDALTDCISYWEKAGMRPASPGYFGTNGPAFMIPALNDVPGINVTGCLATQDGWFLSGKLGILQPIATPAGPVRPGRSFGVWI